MEAGLQSMQQLMGRLQSATARRRPPQAMPAAALIQTTAAATAPTAAQMLRGLTTTMRRGHSFEATELGQDAKCERDFSETHLCNACKRLKCGLRKAAKPFSDPFPGKNSKATVAGQKSQVRNKLQPPSVRL